MYFLISDAAEENFIRWNTLGSYDWPNPPEMVQATTHLKQYTYLLTWFDQRLAWLENNIDTL